MIENIPFNSLLALLVAFCGAFVIAGAWLYLMMVNSKAKRINLSGFGVTLTVDATAATRDDVTATAGDQTASSRQ